MLKNEGLGKRFCGSGSYQRFSFAADDMNRKNHYKYSATKHQLSFESTHSKFCRANIRAHLCSFVVTAPQYSVQN